MTIQPQKTQGSPSLGGAPIGNRNATTSQCYTRENQQLVAQVRQLLRTQKEFLTSLIDNPHPNQKGHQ